MYKKNLIDDLASYAKKNLKKGYSKDSLKWAMINQGHSRLEVEKALQKAQEELASEAPSVSVKPKIEHRVIPIEEEKKSFFGRLFGK